jgi:sortase A
MKKLAIILIIIGVLLAALVLARGLYYSPNGDSGLSIDPQETPVVTSSNVALPSRLIIPKLDIDTHIQHVGVTKTGNMAAPNNFTDVSWYKYGTIPGNTGSAVMAGHVDNALGTPAIFIDLPKMEIGDDVYVTDKDGKRLRFKVVDKELYPYDGAPLKRIFNASNDTYLNLITCQGEWVPEAKSAAKRLVVYTKLVE